MNAEELKMGDWILIDYGFERMEFCVLGKTNKELKLGRSGWTVSSSIWFSNEDVMRKKPAYLSTGKKKIWRILLPIINDLIFPYTKPHEK